MLTAKKSAWFEKVFAIYCRNLFRRRFHSFKVSGLDFLTALEKDVPTIIYCNHSSWWDGLVAFQISNYLKSDSFVMMEEEQLKDLPLFRKLGAFSVIRENPREAVKSISYAVEVLKEKNRVLWIFPQGKILPNDMRPLNFFNGISRIVEKSGKCNAVAIAIRYEFLGEYKPQIFVKIAEPELMIVEEDFNSAILTEKFEGRLSKTLDELKKEINADDTGRFKELI